MRQAKEGMACEKRTGTLVHLQVWNQTDGTLHFAVRMFNLTTVSLSMQSFHKGQHILHTIHSETHTCEKPSLSVVGDFQTVNREYAYVLINLKRRPSKQSVLQDLALLPKLEAHDTFHSAQCF